MIQRRFFSISKKTFKMANILESYYQNGLNNYSSQENKKIIASIVQNHRNVFKDEEQVKVSVSLIKTLKTIISSVLITIIIRISTLNFLV